ncbi:hypothetical protein P389DRAFT_208246 [Cystobasidium minutum MCA 4210]|uniref:uncharacterized protein n=1 Tax=Cystobasidium minutum MCA 4210 TaxID=1397322 RepID=UPI0034CFB236|eukprot:jgi/Rhomi1/208246/estExt_Genemark1.C_1_t30279
MADEMEDKSEGHQDDTEQEIESQASHSLGKDEATAIHQYEYRLRKAAREAARRSNRSSEGGVWSTPLGRSQASGSAPPLSVLHEPDTGRSPSRNTLSSTVSFRRQIDKVDDVPPLASKGEQPNGDFNEGLLPSPPATATESMTSSQNYKLPAKFARTSSLRKASTASSTKSAIDLHPAPSGDEASARSRQVSAAANTPSRRPSSTSSARAPSDGPVASSRRSSSRPVNEAVTTPLLSRSSTSSTKDRTVNVANAPLADAVERDHQSSSPSSPASMIDHGEAATIETETQHTAPSLADELRSHTVPTYDDDDAAYGMPKEVVVGGYLVDISGMDIVDRINMMRRAQEEAKEAKRAQEPLEFYQNMPSTDLSVIAERTECSTVSRRTTIAPTEPSETPRSFLNASFGHQLAPTHTRSHLSVSTTRSGASSAITSSSSSGNGMTQAEKIKNRYLRQAASEGDERGATTSRIGKSTPGRIPGHRKYTSISATNYHTLPLSPTSPTRGGLRNSASAPSIPALHGPTHRSARQGNSNLVPRPITVPSGNVSDLMDPLKTASSGDLPFIPSNVSSSAASRPSPSKHVFSPTISEKIGALQRAGPRPEDEYLTSPMPSKSLLSRQRSKSLHSDDRSSGSSRSKIFGDGAKSPPLPASSSFGLPASKSTSALVQMFESKTAAAAPVEMRSSSPIKAWLDKIDPAKRPTSPGVYPPTPATISSASGSMVDYDAHKRRREKDDNASSAALSASTGRRQQRRRRSQSLTALSEISVNNSPAPAIPASSATTTSFEDSVIIFHGDLYWLDSSSAVRPPFWQACRAIITTSEELRISWLGPKSGNVHERVYDLRSCTAAHSIRRPPQITTKAVQAYEPGSAPPTQDELSRLQVFELVWPGRTHRFACSSLATRIKWLGHIFEVIVRYSNTNTPQTEQEPAPAELSSVGSATLKSLEFPRSTLTRLTSETGSDVSSLVTVPKRHIEKEEQDSLYASVNEMLSGASSARKAGDLPDIPRYQLKDLPSPRDDGSGTPLSQMSLAPRPPRGAWSDIERASTKSDPTNAAPPAAKTVARDLKRLLTMVNRTRAISGSTAIGNGFPDQMKEMQSQLERISRDIRHTSVASRHSRHAPEMVSKMDELLALCKRMAEVKPEDKPKAPLYAQEKLDIIPEQAEVDAESKEVREPEQKQEGLVRLEQKVETLLEVVNRLAAAESPTAQKQSHSLEQSPEQPRIATATRAPSASVPKQPPVGKVSAHQVATAQAMRMLPSTPSLISEIDFDQDLEQWQKYDKKRNSALPPLPPLPPLGAPINLKDSNRGQTMNQQSLKEQAAMTEFYHSFGRRPEPSVSDSAIKHAPAAITDARRKSRPSSIVSSSRVRNARDDAAMRLEGSHPALVAKQSQTARPKDKREPVSKRSADTPLADPNSRRPSVKIAPAKLTDARAKQQTATPIPVIQTDDEEDSSPPTPKQRDFPKATPQRVNLAPIPVLATDTKAQEAIIAQLNSMEGLLQTLVKAQAKQGEALKHQEDVSVYIKHLQEYLAQDRVSRKEEFATIKASLASMSQQISGVPKEVQTLIEASLAVAVLQKPAAAEAVTAAEPIPAPAPDTDPPATDNGSHGDAAVTVGEPDAAVAVKSSAAAAPVQAQKGPAAAPQSQGKKSGTSLLRKVSLGIAGLANVGTGQPAVKVGGPRKMGAGRLFGNGPAGAVAPDAKDRWNADRYKTTAAPANDAPQVETPEQDAPPAPETPLMEALAGLEKDLHGDSDENDERTAVIALGILEVLRMLREKEAREDEREHYRREDAMLKMHQEEERHAEQIEEVRGQLREWEAKLDEYTAAHNRDETSQNIESIIALLKDQMAHQEEALVNLKETLTPQIRDIGAESEEAILAMREEMSKSLADFRTQLDEEVKKTLDEVGALRDQKKQLQSDLSDLLAFKSKYGGGAPEAIQQQQKAPQPQQQQKAASQYGAQYRMPIQPIRPTARQPYLQPYSQAYPPPRPDTSMSAAEPVYQWGLKGPR